MGKLELGRTLLRNIVRPVAIAIAAHVGSGVPELPGYALALLALVVMNVAGVLQRCRHDPIQSRPWSC
jgi:hypothetical protein